jgi:penicillin-insensitive murein endopeptidase
MLAAMMMLALGAEPTFCDERPTAGTPASRGRPAKGRVDGAVELTETTAVRVLPKRHKGRCLSWATPRLIGAIERAGREVQKTYPDSSPLGVGNLGRPRGGSLAPYSHSHQAGRDGDLAFYVLDAQGPVALEDLERFDAQLRSKDGALRFDVPRNWALVSALLGDESIELKWVFVSNALRDALLAHARRSKAAASLIAAAEKVLHQPSDAPPHDDHFHVRIRCTKDERDDGCVD